MAFFPFVNLILGFVSALLLPISTYAGDEGGEPSSLPLSEKRELPKNPFRLSESAYQNVGEGPLALKWKEPKIELPDLRGELAYFGKNERPDYKEKGMVYLGLKSSNESAMVERGKPVYLLYEFASNKARYHFSKSPTALWVELKAEEGATDSLSLMVTAKDENGNLIEEPEDFKNIKLQKEEPTGRHTFFDMNGVRADASLLYRQRAHFVGPDRFFEQHGGKEYGFTQNKERIDFEGESGGYSCFIKEGEGLIWKENRWQMVKEPKESEGFALLSVKRIDDKMVSFELWDGEGKSKVILNLPREQKSETLPDISTDFKFVGAKTWAQFIVDCRGDRMLLKLDEWLLLTAQGWQKIQTEKELDDYIERRVVGLLFILDKWERREGKQVLLGHLFNAQRNEVKEIELPAQVQSSPSSPPPAPPQPPNPIAPPS